MQSTKLYGVNLGGWLVLEKWITPNLFVNLQADDEYTFCLEMGTGADQLLNKHRTTFITTDDLQWIISHDLNAVRVPVGYWLFGDFQPFLQTVSYLDWLMEETKKRNINVIIDLHAAPGSQNGTHHSGMSGEINWHHYPGNINESLNILEKITKRYTNYKNLFGIELLNEPDWHIPKDLLKKFYRNGYEIVRKNSREEVAIIFHDAFKPLEWELFFKENNFKNTYLDLHLYQCFSEEDKNLDIYGHLKKTAIDWKNMIKTIQNYIPVIIGEWSLGLDPQSLSGLSETEKILAKKCYLDTQKLVFENAAGWFFWNYKLINDDMKKDWSYKHLMESHLPKVQ